MPKPPHITAALRSGGFWLHSYLGDLLDVDFSVQCFIIAAFTAIAIFIGSLIDHTLLLGGGDIGLLQHPTIWAFLGLQVALPISMRRSLKHLLVSRTKLRQISAGNGTFQEVVVKPFLKFLHLQNNSGRIAAAIVYSVGFAAFVWNTYQNEHPGKVVPYDFWDSKTYILGFWITRIYKFYLFCWLLPYIAMIHFGILIVILSLIRRARISGQLKIAPFHPDDVGGLGFVPRLVMSPIVAALVMSAIPIAAAFEVHRAAAVTPMMGLTVLVSSTVIAYVVPILFFRSDIIAMKRELIEKLRFLQQTYYSIIIDGKELDFEALKKGSEALDYFEKVCARIQSISNYPHLKRLLKFVGLSLTPSVISLALKLYEYVSPVIGSASKKP